LVEVQGGKKKSRAAASEAGEDDAKKGAEDGGARPFRIPESYFEHYLDGGKPKEEAEPDYPAIRPAGQAGKLAEEHGLGFHSADRDWLYRALQLERFLGENTKLAPMEVRKPLLVELSGLTAADRRMLRKHCSTRGADDRITIALGPEGLSFLADTPPPPP